MTKQIAKPYFRDWSNLRFHKGKQFIANDRLFRAEHALFFPNFFGKTLRKDAVKKDAKDGYGGLGRNTCEALEGKVSVVTIVNAMWAQDQVDTFCSRTANPELHYLLDNAKDCAQVVGINHEETFSRWWIMQLTALGNLRRGKSLEEQERYFMVRRGISDMMKEGLGLLNEKVGYVYLVDQENRIRWAGSAKAEPSEKESMVRGLKRLIQEVRMPAAEKQDPQVLEDAVTEVVEEPKASASG